MEIAYKIIVILQVVAALGVIGLVLLQHGKGADMGAAFGSGSAGSLFGASGSANFMSRTTGILAALFMAMTLGLAFIASHAGKPSTGGGVMDGLPASAPAKAPAPDNKPAGIPAQGAPASGTPTAPATGSSAVPVPAAAPAAAAPAAPAASAPAPAPAPATTEAPKK